MTETMNASFTHEDMIRKVAALLETAASFTENGNDEAAESYIQKAHALQQKYSIDQAMIESRTGVKTEKIISKRIRMNGRHGKRKVTLAHVIAKRTNCTGYYDRAHSWNPEKGESDTANYYYNCFGFESDVDHVEFMVNSLNAQADSALAYATKVHKSPHEHGKSFSASFLAGFTDSISRRLSEAQRAARAEAQAEANRHHMENLQPGDAISAPTESVALVLASKTQQVEDEMRARVGKLGKGTTSQTTSRSGYSAGHSAGSSATIARGGVSGGSRGALR